MTIAGWNMPKRGLLPRCPQAGVLPPSRSLPASPTFGPGRPEMPLWRCCLSRILRPGGQLLLFEMHSSWRSSKALGLVGILSPTCTAFKLQSTCPSFQILHAACVQREQNGRPRPRYARLPFECTFDSRPHRPTFRC